MTPFALTLASPREIVQLDAVAHFIGTDASGRFGLLPGHTPLITVLRFGLARLRPADTPHWRYLALPGGTLHFADNHLHIACRHFTLGDDAAALQAALARTARQEDARRADLRHNLDRFEQTLMQRLWEMQR
jgi:F-type H+-transporting ATPase subunit epsilon